MSGTVSTIIRRTTSNSGLSKLRNGKQGHHSHTNSGTISSGSPPLRDVTFVPDSLASECFRCRSTFTITKRRHHCRSCGNCLCASCSSKRIVLPQHNSQTAAASPSSASSPVRVCDDCYHKHAQRAQMRSMRRPSHVQPIADYAQQQQSWHEQQQALAASSSMHGIATSTNGSNLSLDQQPWNDASWTYQSGSGQGWGINSNIEAGARWFSSLIFTDPNAATPNGASTAATAMNGNSATADSSKEMPVHINPNHIEAATSTAALPALHGGELRLAHTASSRGLGLTTQALLTPDQLTSFTLLLFNSFLCVNINQERIKLHLTDIIFHTLPRKHLESCTNEVEVEEAITKRTAKYLLSIQAQVRKNRDEWIEFMTKYDYDAPPPSQPQPPSFLPYPAHPPPICSGSILITNYQLVFIPDYTLLIYSSHVLASEERRRWRAKRSAMSTERERVNVVISDPIPPSPVSRVSVSPDPGATSEPIPIANKLEGIPSPLPSPQETIPAAILSLGDNESIWESRGKESEMSPPQPVQLPEATPTASRTESPELNGSANLPPSAPPSHRSSTAPIIPSYKNASHLHLPHYRLFQQYIESATGSPNDISDVDFEPLAFAPPFITIPFLALRKMKAASYDRQDTGTIELKTKLHHGVLRFVLTNLIKKQRFSAFKNLSKCIDFYHLYQPAQPGTLMLTDAHTHQMKHGNVTPASATTATTPAQPATDAHKVFAFRHAVPVASLSTQMTNGNGTNGATSIAPPSNATATNGATSTSLSPSPPPPSSTTEVGWTIYDAAKEYRRMGLISSTSASGANGVSSSPTTSGFRLSDLNRSYSFSPSYPRQFIVPAGIHDMELMSVASFRSKRRIPVVCWSGNAPTPPIPSMSARPSDDASINIPIRPAKPAVLLRSAQPLTGLTGQRCSEDEILLHHACAAISTDRLLLVDCRPYANAMGQAALGAGYENISCYLAPPTKPGAVHAVKEAQIQFLNIDNIHAVRKSHALVEKLIAKLIEDEAEMDLAGWRTDSGVRIPVAATNSLTPSSSVSNSSRSSMIDPSTTLTVPSASSVTISAPNTVAFPTLHPSLASWTSQLHASQHFVHLSNILSGVSQVLSCLSQGICVLVHCSDGWDRTALVTSLSQLCLDGYYRTIEGFIVLIEKEWLAFGHRFGDRLGHGHFSSEVSPIFLQFLDCVYQYIEQFPSHFEFDQRFLIFIHYHAYAGLYGTFMFNSEMERTQNHAAEKTHSVWTYVCEHLREFVNPLYGLGWSELSSSSDEAMNDRAQQESEVHPAFATLPRYNDRCILYLDVKSLRFWDEMYFSSRKPLTWSCQPSITSSRSSKHINMNPKMDVNPIQLHLEQIEKHELIETMQLRADKLEIESCMERMCAKIESDSLQSQLAVSIASSAVTSIVDTAYIALLHSWMKREIEKRVLEAQRAHVLTRVSEEEEGEVDATPKLLSHASHNGHTPVTSAPTTPVTPDRRATHTSSSSLEVPPSTHRSRSVSTASTSPSTSSTSTSFVTNGLASIASALTSPSSSTPASTNLTEAELASLLNIPVVLKDQKDYRKDTKCYKCSLTFGFVFGRSHHCKLCARSCCDNCAPKRELLVERIIQSQYISGREESQQKTTGRAEVRACQSCIKHLLHQSRVVLHEDDAHSTTTQRHIPISPETSQRNSRSNSLSSTDSVRQHPGMQRINIAPNSFTAASLHKQHYHPPQHHPHSWTNHTNNNSHLADQRAK